MALSHLDGVESFDIKSDISDKASRSSDAEHDIIGTRRCTALIIQDSDGTDDEMHDGYHLTYCRVIAASEEFDTSLISNGSTLVDESMETTFDDTLAVTLLEAMFCRKRFH